MSYKITDTVIVDQNRNIASIGIATFAGPVLIGGGSSTGTVSQPLQVTGSNGGYIGGNLGIGSTNPSSKLSVIGDATFSGIVTSSVVNASKDPGTGIATDFTNSLFGNGWRVSSPGSTTYYKLATLPPGGGGNTFDHLRIEGILGAWTNDNQTPFDIIFSNRGAFDYKYISYGSIRSDVRIIGISTNSTVEIWAQHQASAFTKLVYNITESVQAIVVSNPTSTTTAPVGTTVFDSSTVTPRFIINESDNIGIGTTNPGSKLTVNGAVQIQQDSGSNNRFILRGQPASLYRWNIDNNGSSNDFRIFREDDVTAANGSIAVSISTIGTLTATKFSGDGSLLTNLPPASSQWVTTAAGIHTLSNVGIGTTNPTSTLTVTGSGTTTTQLTVSGVSTFAGITTVTGPTLFSRQLNVSGVSTFAGITTSTSTLFANQLSVSGVSTFVGIATYRAGLFGTTASFTGIVTASSFRGDGSQLTGIGGTTDVRTNSLVVTGVSTLGTLRVASGIVSATSGVVTYYGDGSPLTDVSFDGYNTGITSAVSATLTGIGDNVIVLPSTAGREYVIYSINCSNVAVGNTEVNVIGAFDINSTSERSYFAYNIPIPTGTAVELLKQPQVLNPSDRIVMRSTDYNRAGIETAVQVYISYREVTTTKLFGIGVGTVSVASTDQTNVYTATSPALIQSIRLANRTDSGAYPVSVRVTSGVTTINLVDNLLVPKYGSVEILDTPKRLNTNDILSVQLDQWGTVDVQVSGKLIS